MDLRVSGGCAGCLLRGPIHWDAGACGGTVRGVGSGAGSGFLLSSADSLAFQWSGRLEDRHRLKCTCSGGSSGRTTHLRAHPEGNKAATRDSRKSGRIREWGDLRLGLRCRSPGRSGAIDGVRGQASGRAAIGSALPAGCSGNYELFGQVWVLRGFGRNSPERFGRMGRRKAAERELSGKRASISEF